MAALAASAVFLGCGSDSGSTAADQSSEPLTKAEFVSQANLICEQGIKKKDQAVGKALKERAAQATAEPTADEIAKLVEENVFPTYQQTIEQLSQLAAPESDKAKAEKIVAEFESALRTAEAEPAKAAHSSPFGPADKVAAAYGIENCRL